MPIRSEPVRGPSSLWTAGLCMLPAVTAVTLLSSLSLPEQPPVSPANPGPRPHLQVRGVYGGVPRELVEGYGGLEAAGVNAIFLGSGVFTEEVLSWLRGQGVRVYAEFNSLHEARYVEAHPDAAPVGPDGNVCPPPDGWQGVCPTHEGYRRHRMDAFRELLQRYALDGVWLDYHHSHASWEQAEPNLPDTCFCARCLNQFQRDSGVSLPEETVAEKSRRLLSEFRDEWTRWRCDVLTDWVREYRELLDRHRPGALLGTFHNPWSDTDFGGARLHKLAIDLRSQARYVDVFSPMPYHARFGHSGDPGWISRQVAWLGEDLGPDRMAGKQIWPIVQLSDWGERVPAEQVFEILDHGSRPPATGVIVFAWSGLRRDPAKIQALVDFFRTVRP